MGRPQIVVLPTGARKSLCFQLPALLLDGPTLVLMPLLSLLSDQMRRMREAEIPAGSFLGGLSPADKEHLFRAVTQAGHRRLVTRLADGIRAALARRAPCFRAGELKAVWVPDKALEALRDLVRAREAAKQDRLRAGHRLGKSASTKESAAADMRAWMQQYLEWIDPRSAPACPKPMRAVLMTKEPEFDQLVTANMRMAALSHKRSAVDSRKSAKNRDRCASSPPSADAFTCTNRPAMIYSVDRKHKSIMPGA